MPSETDPFVGFVTFLPNKTWICKYCGFYYGGSTTQIMAHLAGVPGYGIKGCEHVDTSAIAEAFRAFKSISAAESSNRQGNVEEGPHQLAFKSRWAAESSNRQGNVEECPHHAESSNRQGNVEEGPHQLVTSFAAVPGWRFDGTSTEVGSMSGLISLLEMEVLNLSLPAQNMIPQRGFSFRPEPLQSHAGESSITRWNLSDHFGLLDLATEAAPEATEFLQGTFPGGNVGRIDNNDDKLMKHNYLFDGGIGRHRIGKITITTKEIGKGSDGTVIFEGWYDIRQVAVKRLVRSYHDVALNEIQRLIESDQHQNIVRYYGVELDRDFVYLAIELCAGNLEDLILARPDSSNHSVFTCDPASVGRYKSKSNSVKDAMQDVELWRAGGHPSPLLLDLMRDVVLGVARLHELKIVHLDIKPQNVLISNNGQLSAKLCDMGISRRLPQGKSSLGYRDKGCGSSGWQAPELICHGRQTRAMDLFSLGCVLFFCVTRGSHPFGDPFERDYKIAKDQKNLSLVEFIPEAKDLFLRLLDPDPKSRPSTSEVLFHPFFWSSNTRLSFLCQMSDKVQYEKNNHPNSDFLKELESKAPLVLGGDWNLIIDGVFMDDIAKRPYNYSLVRDLLRAVRNKAFHHYELTEDIRDLFKKYHDGFYGYFAAKFPRLLIESYRVASQFCKEDEAFQKYFPIEEQHRMGCELFNHFPR